jgi:hypothetical protein
VINPKLVRMLSRMTASWGPKDDKERSMMNLGTEDSKQMNTQVRIIGMILLWKNLCKPI